ncbi:uncharacterized protein K489DRAFT_394158 [Dissoconium aciculare CBS 342.82]|uniref:RING-type domain-containing protein n=1 Tax=Dissoconium aciculare CBS 342.82 TaxID=1314786 RepID=A0A6J3M6H4_9PEZI|nr:uncharacterized protein K489DRAFT_394158 [Dissoconium aciculare CBS 342.82]KAF1823610.1 hypothetical protein K489DRAFT_394158 [Dissoconium aciculare CBS 342.82]
MSGYEGGHYLERRREEEQRAPRRPDLATFFSTLELVDTSGNRQPQNINSVPLPQDISAAYRNLANAFNTMTRPADDPNTALLDQLVEQLMASAEHPPSQVDGVSDEFLEQLERVPKKNLKSEQSCPICSNPFLEDPHPLVVRLSCHKDHIFDLECITPWLKLNPTCPLDRQVLIKKKVVVPPPADDDEDEYDDMYA